MRISMAALCVACVYFIHPFANGEDQMPNSVLDFTLDSIDGKPYALSQHKGQVLLIVNVASKCGFTPQYAGLEKIYTKYHEKGFTIIGVPANEFGHQEPGTNEEIKQFCSSKYSVTFPMLAKVVVKGDGIAPLYKFLTEKGPNPGPITWNFNKYLVGRDGRLIARYDSKAAPESKDLTDAIEKALDEKAK